MSSQPTDVAGGTTAGAGVLAAALQTVAQPVWIVDRDGLIQFANAAAVAALGYSDLDELIGRQSHRTIHHHRPDGRPYPVEECPLLLPRTTGQTVTCDLDWFFRRDGSMFRVSYVSAPLEMAGGRGAVVAFHDIESRLRAEKALREREAILAEQQEALRRVAKLVARGLEPELVFRAVADEVHALLAADISAIVRFESDGTVTAVGAHGGPYVAGSRVEADPGYVVASVRETGQAARFDADDPGVPGISEVVRAVGIRSGLASPIVVDGEVWGAITVGSLVGPLPAVVEARLADFTELVAAVISNAQAREDLRRMADEQAALRRVATLVAQDVASDELFGAVAGEVGTLFGADYTGMIRYEPDPAFVSTMATWAAVGEHPRAPARSRTVPGDPTAMVADTGQPARVDDWANVPGRIAEFVRRELGVRSSVGSPIVVNGRLWGALAVHSKRGPLASDTEGRLLSFTELVATAIANTSARAEVSRLAEEQSALRRIAMLVAGEASEAEVFGAIAKEIGKVFGLDEIWILRYDGDRGAVVVGSAGNQSVFQPGARQPLERDTAALRVLRTGHTVRIDNYKALSGPVADTARSIGVQSAVGAPILVQGRLWGAIVAGSKQSAPLPPETESRLGQFTELMATAIANAEARSEVERLADEQAALRRVAMLVATEAPPAEVFAKVAAEVGNAVGGVDCALCKDESNGTITTLAAWGNEMLGTIRVGERFPIDGTSVVARVLGEGRQCRIDDYSTATGTIAERGKASGIRSAAGCPIVVHGRTWGALAVAKYDADPLPLGTERRIVRFADLAATAIANAAARAEVRRLAEEQAALRRVATLVAQGASPRMVLDAVAAEMQLVLEADAVTIGRYEAGDEMTVVAHRSPEPSRLAIGTRTNHDGENVMAKVRRTERPARLEDLGGAHSGFTDLFRDLGMRAAVGTPILVDGRLWGAIIGSWAREESPPSDTEERMAKFAELLETAIANADSRDQLTASRARLVTEADQARRRVVRDLHDGAQQRLVHTVVTLKLAQRALQANDDEADSLIADALRNAQQGNAELRELAHGLLPAVLAQGGLPAGLNAIVSRTDLPVEVDVPAERLPADIEASAYFVVAEALTNVMKHAHANSAGVTAFIDSGTLHVEVRDDGLGGADPDGHGLVGLRDRVTAFGGQLTVESPAGDGTVLIATLPLSFT